MQILATRPESVESRVRLTLEDACGMMLSSSFSGFRGFSFSFFSFFHFQLPNFPIFQFFQFFHFSISNTPIFQFSNFQFFHFFISSPFHFSLRFSLFTLHPSFFFFIFHFSFSTFRFPLSTPSLPRSRTPSLSNYSRLLQFHGGAGGCFAQAATVPTSANEAAQATE